LSSIKISLISARLNEIIKILVLHHAHVYLLYAMKQCLHSNNTHHKLEANTLSVLDLK